MFKDDNLSESVSQEVTIDDFAPEVMEMFLNFVFGNEIEMPNAIVATDLLMAADKYNVAGLVRFCEQQV
jgi:hypothetical protein